jgi:IS5 family transposase
MLRIYASRQRSFADYLLDDALKSNELLSAAAAALDRIPELIKPFVDKYEQDRKDNGINADFGRPTIALESFVRLMLLKFLHKDCDYRDVELRAKTDLAWKAFAKLGAADKVPDYSSISKWETFFGEEAIRELHGRIMEYCVKEKIAKGRMMRTDSTAVEANVHYPTDPSLLGDAVRSITKTVEKIRSKIKIKTVFRSRVKLIKKKIFDLMNSLKKRTGQGKEMARRTTQEVNRIAAQIVAKAKLIIGEIAGSEEVAGIKGILDSQIEIADKLIAQTEKVLDGIKPADRIISFFQPFVRPIVKGKLRAACEFGKKLEISEVENNIISDWKIHAGNPNDADILIAAADRHKERFGRDPSMIATDRGYWSEKNEKELKSRTRKVSIPIRGNKSKRRLRTEKSAWFRELQNWRAGGEAKISQLKRVFGMNRSKAKTEKGFDNSIGWGIVGCNLKTIARLAG